MPQIGDIKRGRYIGLKPIYNNFIWHACIDCGKEKWGRLIKGKPRHLRCNICAGKIRGVLLTKEKRGDKSPNWRGGLTLLVTRLRASSEYHQWHTAVLERDNFICRGCSKTDKLEAHHTKEIIEYPELIFDVDNGITLCKDCHELNTAWSWLRPKRTPNTFKLAIHKLNGLKSLIQQSRKYKVSLEEG